MNAMRTYRFTFLLFFIVSCSSNTGTIKIKGSDTEVNLAARLAENFHKKDNSLNVSVSGGGSGLGIASLLNGQADIANSSRALNTDEINLFNERKIELKTLAFAEDAVAFVVSKSFPLDSLTAEQLANILSGKFNNWKFITGQDIAINIYGRQNNSGTYGFIKQKLNIEYSPEAKQMNGNAQIIEAIKVDNSGIGYVGAGYVMAKNAAPKLGIKVLKIAAAKNETAISPLDEQAIANKQYFFQRPLYQFIRKESFKKVEPFLAFEQSEQGLAIIKASGYYSVPK
jgi:phosphate transport system substrate-binding protein